MSTFPLKAIVIQIALESMLFGYQSSIISESFHSRTGSHLLKGFFLDLLSLIITILAMLYMEKLKTGGRRKFLLHNTLILVLNK